MGKQVTKASSLTYPQIYPYSFLKLEASEDKEIFFLFVFLVNCWANIPSL